MRSVVLDARGLVGPLYVTTCRLSDFLYHTLSCLPDALNAPLQVCPLRDGGQVVTTASALSVIVVNTINDAEWRVHLFQLLHPRVPVASRQHQTLLHLILNSSLTISPPGNAPMLYRALPTLGIVPALACKSSPLVPASLQCCQMPVSTGQSSHRCAAEPSRMSCTPAAPPCGNA
jgi:hypothetical protein